MSLICQTRNRMADDIREAFGPDILAEVSRPLAWTSGLLAERERFACKPERRRSHSSRSNG